MKSRFFFRIYVILVVTIVVAGWLLNQVWDSQHVSPFDQQHSAKLVASAIQTMMQSEQVTPSQSSTIGAYLEQLNQNSPIRWQLLDRAEVYISEDSLQALQSGRVIELYDGDQQVLLLMALSPQLYLGAKYPVSSARESEKLLLAAFYFCLAIGLFIAFRPLFNDIRDLRSQVSQLGQNNWHINQQQKSSPFAEVRSSIAEMAQRIQSLIATQQELSHAIAHELRTPLARMKFSLATIEADDTHSSAVNSMRDDIAELEALVSEMLDYASFDADAYQLNKSQGNVNKLLHRLVERLPITETISITTHYCQSAVVDCDWHLVERALQNIVLNAAKYAANTIAITTTHANQWVTIEIADDGPGIPQDQRDRVFESFVRLSTANKNNQHKGFGLGLAIAKRIVELHQGQIAYADSELGGASFVVRLPVL